MRKRVGRMIALAAALSGSLLAGSCSVEDSVLETIRLAFNIVNVWA